MTTWRQRIGSWLLARKESDVARAVYLLTGGSAVWRPQNYELYSREGYGQNVTVYACVNEIARSIGGLTWTLQKKGTGKGSRARQDIESHPLLDLLARPNPKQGGAAFFGTMTGFWLISGNNYLNIIAPTKGLPKELWNLRPDRISIVPSRIASEVAAYRYEVGGTRIDIPPDRIMHTVMFNPVDDWYGMSPLQVAARLIDTDAEAVRWNKALLQNSARPSGALSTDQTLSDPQYDRLKVQMEEKYQGALNSGRPLLLEGGLSWQQISLNPSDMDWLNGRKMTKREICQVYQVPPELMGDSESKTYSNYQEARKAFYQETVLPLASHLRDDLNANLVPRFGDGLVLDIDKDDIEALAEEQSALWERVRSADWLTINEKRDLTGYDEIDGGDVILVSATMVPLESAGQPPDVNNPSGDRAIDLGPSSESKKPDATKPDAEASA